MFLQSLFSHRQMTPAVEPVVIPEPEIVRRDFTIVDYAEMRPIDLLSALRQKTVNFSHEFQTTWAVTDFFFDDTLIRVKLTEDQDIVYVIDGQQTFDLREAIQLVKTVTVQF